MAETGDVKVTMPEPEAQNLGAEESMDKVKDNPYIENSQLKGVKLRIPDSAFVPKPFKKIKHVIIVSYVCYLFLIFPGAIANQYAWEAKKYKELGAPSEAKAMARSAVCWIYVGFAIGAVCALILVIVLPLTV